jgi:hypothetical protein
MTAGSSQRTGRLFGGRLICEEEERRPGPPWGALGGGYERPGRKGTRLGGVRQLVVRSGPMVHLLPNNCRHGRVVTSKALRVGSQGSTPALQGRSRPAPRPPEPPTR